MIAVELIYIGTIVIGIYMRNNQKEKVLEELIKIRQRIRRKYNKPNIIVDGDFNTNNNWSIKLIENRTKLK